MTVFVTTPTPRPSPTMTLYQTQATAVIQTQVADLVPKPCTETTVVPGESKVCWWPTPTVEPQPTPAYQTCSTPVPAQYCLKVSDG